jgi:hypothetical protein
MSWVMYSVVDTDANAMRYAGQTIFRAASTPG